MSLKQDNPQEWENRRLFDQAHPGQRYDELGRRLCQGKKKTGEPCMAPAMAGQFRCRAHGGNRQDSKRKARIRMAELVDPAIATLAKEMMKAETSRDRQNAANSILDRAGYGRASKVEYEDAKALLLERVAEMKKQQMEEEEGDGDE